MSSSYSYSDSYTVTDIRKVMDKIHADMRMIAQYTRLWDQFYVDKVMADVMSFAEKDYIKRIRIRLIGSNDRNVRVYDYNIFKNTSGWTSDHAGGNLWSGIADRMSVTISYSSEWDALSESAKAKFQADLNLGWSTTTDDLSVDHLTLSPNRTYASNGYGAKKDIYG